jgi:hypothetical protein
LLEAQADNVKPGPTAITVAHGEVDFLSCEVDVMQGRGNPQIDLRMRLGKPAETMHQPLGGKIR